jgi:hypothetical protein
MSWEIEYEEVDKAEGTHRFGMIERSVITRDGQPARAKFHIILGTGHDGESCGHCTQPVKRDIHLHDDGALHHDIHGEVSPHELAKEHLAKLNGFHGRMDAYAKKHKAAIYKGPKQ